MSARKSTDSKVCVDTFFIKITAKSLNKLKKIKINFTF